MPAFCRRPRLVDRTAPARNAVHGLPAAAASRARMSGRFRSRPGHSNSSSSSRERAPVSPGGTRPGRLDLSSRPATSSSRTRRRPWPAGSRSSRARRSCSGPAAACAARRLPGDRCGGQGQHDQARDVGREPAGRPGRLLQAALGRGARPRLPLAHLERAPRARPHRDLQPLALRGGRRGARPPRMAGAPEAARRRAGQAFWEERYEDINAFERHLDRSRTKIVKFFLHVSKEEQRKRFLARLTTRERCGSSTPPTSPSGRTGTSTWRPTRTR